MKILLLFTFLDFHICEQKKATMKYLLLITVCLLQQALQIKSDMNNDQVSLLKTEISKNISKITGLKKTQIKEKYSLQERKQYIWFVNEYHCHHTRNLATTENKDMFDFKIVAFYIKVLLITIVVLLVQHIWQSIFILRNEGYQNALMFFVCPNKYELIKVQNRLLAVRRLIEE